MGGTFATIVGWAFGLVLAYLLLTNYTGGSSLINAGGGQSVNVLKTLQGR